MLHSNISFRFELVSAFSHFHSNWHRSGGLVNDFNCAGRVYRMCSKHLCSGLFKMLKITIKLKNLLRQKLNVSIMVSEIKLI